MDSARDPLVPRRFARCAAAATAGLFLAVAAGGSPPALGAPAKGGSRLSVRNVHSSTVPDAVASETQSTHSLLWYRRKKTRSSRL